jgi:3-deoxy-D-manno-octulosonic-acid transferase
LRCSIQNQAFVEGRKCFFSTLELKIKPSDKTIWFHAASLGEYEQGLPVIEKIKKEYPLHKIVITFLPSGYEVKIIPLQTQLFIYHWTLEKNAQQFLELVHPDIVFFIKYEYWLNYLNELNKQSTPTYLISEYLENNKCSLDGTAVTEKH